MSVNYFEKLKKHIFPVPPLTFGKLTTSSDHDGHEYDDEEEEEDHTNDDNDNNVTLDSRWRYLERRMRSAAEEVGKAVRS